MTKVLTQEEEQKAVVASMLTNIQKAMTFFPDFENQEKMKELKAIFGQDETFCRLSTVDSLIQAFFGLENVEYKLKKHLGLEV